MTQIPIAQPDIGKQETEAVAEVLRSGYISEGPRVAELEESFAAYTGAEEAVACVNGTAALQMALTSLGVGDGDEVVVPAMTFVATANMVAACGARPVLVDIDPRTYTMDPAKAAEAITDRTAALLPVHLYGHPADVDALSDLAEDHDLVVIGDAAQAHGAAWDGTRVGALFDAETFSFYPTKNMTTGEGGMATFRDADVADRARSLRNHGREGGSHDHARLGYNWRMTDVAAAIGTAQLDRLETFNAARRRNADRLTEGLQGLDGIELPTEAGKAHHVYHQYTIRCSDVDREDLQDHLDEEGIGARVYYPDPVHAHPHLERFGHDDLEEAERAADEVLSLPVHPAVSDEDVDRIVDAVRSHV